MLNLLLILSLASIHKLGDFQQQVMKVTLAH
uniref:Uncharacterized protein n=1 Tax=Setaria viridis TaxID=4556 RepID=A0A4U6TZU3_SETVI|nr:hypothetical protein SEVIR_7G302933v2 [Setaria viridis]